jgi:hypothetical protein
MINPGDAIDKIVDALQHITDLTDAIGGPANILPYHPTFPGKMYFKQDLDALLPGQILVRYLGTVPAQFRENRIFRHDFGLYQMPPNTSDADTSAGHYEFLVALINGVPSNGDGNKMLNYAVVQNCDIMDVPRAAIYTDVTLKRDYFFVTFSFPEIGDN